MDNKKVLIALVLIVVGGLVGWAVGSRSQGTGPVSGLQAVPSSANLETNVCLEIFGKGWVEAGVVPGPNGGSKLTCRNTSTGELRFITLSTGVGGDDGGPLLE